MSAYYNEFDPLKAEVLREAIRAGVIATGDVDERSISDVRAGDLRGYKQCHFFAGGGFWSLAFRIAGIPDNWPWWSGSCPCPSFSPAGKGEGFEDPRHLWPEWDRLIGECRPPVVFGEQSSAAIGFGWLDLVQANMEARHYALGKIVFGAHSVGAPHIRQRLYFGADIAGSYATDGNGRGGECGEEAGTRSNTEWWRGFAGDRTPVSSSHTEHNGGRSNVSQWETTGRIVDGRDRAVVDSPNTDGRQSGDGNVQRSGEYGLFTENCGAGADGVDLDAISAGLQGHGRNEPEWRGPGWLPPEQARSVAAAGATRGFWSGCDWWLGRAEPKYPEGRYRPIGPGLFPLVNGGAARMGRLRLYGDAIVVPQAAEFIKAYCEARSIA